MYSNYVAPRMRYILGFFLIAVCFAFVIYNTTVIIVYSIRIFSVFLRRIFVQCRRKRMRTEVLQMVSLLNTKQEPAPQ